MKKQKHYSQLKDQESSLERTNDETDLFSLIHWFLKGDNENTEGIKKVYQEKFRLLLTKKKKKELETIIGTKKN